MTLLIDLSGAPSGEACAQLGKTANFAIANALEVDAYRAAIIAVYGPPPDGVVLRAQYHHHEFGIYRTLGLAAVKRRTRIDVPAQSAAVTAYATRIEPGLAYWHQACMTAPVIYNDDQQVLRRKASIVDVVMDALMTSRPAGDGRFPVAQFEEVHANLTLEWPELARAHASIMARETSGVE
jgi:hypothetical protein